jgi:hypothetical protein
VILPLLPAPLCRRPLVPTRDFLTAPSLVVVTCHQVTSETIFRRFQNSNRYVICLFNTLG